MPWFRMPRWTRRALRQPVASQKPSPVQPYSCLATWMRRLRWNIHQRNCEVGLLFCTIQVKQCPDMLNEFVAWTAWLVVSSNNKYFEHRKVQKDTHHTCPKDRVCGLENLVRDLQASASWGFSLTSSVNTTRPLGFVVQKAQTNALAPAHQLMMLLFALSTPTDRWAEDRLSCAELFYVTGRMNIDYSCFTPVPHLL